MIGQTYTVCQDCKSIIKLYNGCRTLREYDLSKDSPAIFNITIS
jgi:hypothetical protein